MTMYDEQVKEHFGMLGSFILQEARVAESSFSYLLAASATQCLHKVTQIE